MKECGKLTEKPADRRIITFPYIQFYINLIVFLTNQYENVDT